MSDTELVYLINTTSDESAGWYDPGVARVLLAESSNWEKADPPTEEPAGQPGRRRAAEDGTPPGGVQPPA